MVVAVNQIHAAQFCWELQPAMSALSLLTEHLSSIPIHMGEAIY